jgi:hypothetical protein
MASFTNLTLNTKVYSPAYYRGDVAAWMNRDAGVSAGFSLLTQRVYTAAGGQGKGAVHSVHKLTVPIVATTDSDCSCAGTLLRESGVEVHGWFAPGSSVAERTDILERFRSLVASDAFADTFVNLAPVISNS